MNTASFHYLQNGPVFLRFRPSLLFVFSFLDFLTVSFEFGFCQHDLVGSFLLYVSYFIFKIVWEWNTKFHTWYQVLAELGLVHQLS